ncbi:MAG: hypothetical protein WBP72_16900, partial [Rhodocyclaceae bacterium]
MVISDFQLSIIAVGALGVAAVFAYNKWLERRYLRQLERESGSPAVNPPLEPKVAEEDESFAADDLQERVEPMAPRGPDEDFTEDFAEEELEAPATEPAMPLVHPGADFMVPFEAVEPIDVQQLLTAAGEALGGVDKPVRFLGWNAVRKVWQVAGAPGSTPSAQWRIALQLADRRGPLGAKAIEAFIGGVRQLADRFMAVTDLPDRVQLLQRAQALDKF